MSNTTKLFDPKSITRPDPSLFTYYLFVSALALIAFPIVFLPLYFKFHTLQYRFDEKGVSMSWGILFKREISLTYRRIQDIHVTRNLFHRWLGLAAVGVQTASGSAGSEMMIEGIRNPEALRDYLYARMRGAHDASASAVSESGEDGVGAADASAVSDDASLTLLRDILREVERLRSEMERRS